MAAEWYLIAAILGHNVNGYGGASVPMQNKTACLVAAGALLVHQQHRTASVYCINTKTGEVVKP